MTIRTRLSVCRRKRRFANLEEASSVGAALLLLPYRCDRCRQIHLTSRRKGKWQARPPCG